MAKVLIRKAEVVGVINETNKKNFFTATRAGRTSVDGEENEAIEYIPEVLSQPHQFEEYLKNYRGPVFRTRFVQDTNTVI